jgi:uncharacterized membrane protein
MRIIFNSSPYHIMTSAQPVVKTRIRSIDILRGGIMLIMALDHVRDFFHVAGPFNDPTDMATTTPFLFFTRWITHFCAPAFVFLSGISACLAGSKRTTSQLSSFLIKRGLWLMLVEVIVLTFAFSLNPFYNFFILQVLWAIGCSMFILGLLVWLPRWAIALIGGLIFFGHDILDYLQLPKDGVENVLLRFFLTTKGTVLPLNHNHYVFDLYAIIPWTGVMLLGYVFGSLYKTGFDQHSRKRILLFTGIGTLLFFVVFRLFNIYGDPSPWSVQRNGVFSVLSFFNVSKYPPSLMYSCMTIGTSLIILSLTENLQNKFTAILVTYGNVPFFYYILHFYLIRFFSIVLFFASGYHTSQIVQPNQRFLFRPATFGYNLAGVYVIWFVVIFILYFPCRWFSRYKKTHQQWWLSYL